MPKVLSACSGLVARRMLSTLLLVMLGTAASATAATAAQGVFCEGGGSSPSVSRGSPDSIFRSSFDERWVDFTGPTFWQCNANCSVVGGQFVESGPGMTINPVGDWVLGFRPIAVRVDASISPMDQLGVGCGSGGTDFGVCAGYVVGTACILNVTDNLQRMNLYNSGTIRKIEFLVR
jgi:hypothetical protein